MPPALWSAELDCLPCHCNSLFRCKLQLDVPAEAGVRALGTEQQGSCRSRACILNRYACRLMLIDATFF